MNIKPIRNDEDHAAALAIIETLMDAKPNTPAGDKLDVLVTLVEAYEAKHHPIPPPDPIDAIKFAMEQRALKPKDVVGLFGSRSKVSEVLDRKRPLSVNMMRRLQVGLGIPAEILLRDTSDLSGRAASSRSSTKLVRGKKPRRGTRTINAWTVASGRSKSFKSGRAAKKK